MKLISSGFRGLRPLSLIASLACGHFYLLSFSGNRDTPYQCVLMKISEPGPWTLQVYPEAAFMWSRTLAPTVGSGEGAEWLTVQTSLEFLR